MHLGFPALEIRTRLSILHFEVSIYVHKCDGLYQYRERATARCVFKTWADSWAFLQWWTAKLGWGFGCAKGGSAIELKSLQTHWEICCTWGQFWSKETELAVGPMPPFSIIRNSDLSGNWREERLISLFFSLNKLVLVGSDGSER